MTKSIDLTGQIFFRLTVIEKGKPNNGRTTWLCQCVCGNIKIIKTEHLKNNTTKSCGCLNKETSRLNGIKMGKSNIKYPPYITSARRVWKKRYNDGISFEDFLIISQQNCYYCGNKPNNKQNAAKEDIKSSQFAKDNGEFIYNGLDRVDNSKKHIIDNVVPCCKWCNYAKRERTVTEFQEWIMNVFNKICKIL